MFKWTIILAPTFLEKKCNLELVKVLYFTHTSFLLLVDLWMTNFQLPLTKLFSLLLHELVFFLGYYFTLSVSIHCIFYHTNEA